MAGVEVVRFAWGAVFPFAVTVRADGHPVAASQPVAHCVHSRAGVVRTAGADDAPGQS